jgi:predicted membrane-bound mannosyltransferase
VSFAATSERRLAWRRAEFRLAPAWPVAIATLAALAARLALRIDYAEELDSIRFLLALERFDVTQYQPHFPGYPVFVLLGRGFLWLMGSPISALATLCAVCGALLSIPAAALARETLGEREAWWAAWLVAANPLLWLHSQMLLSDLPGLLLLKSLSE